VDAIMTERADRAFARALEATGARDPREFYRSRMMELRQSDPDAFARARTYYEETLVPAVAGGAADPIQAWLEYGRLLAEWTAPGRTVMVDGSGRATPWASPVPLDRLVLHLPDGRGGGAIPVGIPPELTPAQRATWDLLVKMKRELS
jgi:hypothetical protein